jgi:predicted DNA-binding transcriptional regulator AlpA
MAVLSALWYAYNGDRRRDGSPGEGTRPPRLVRATATPLQTDAQLENATTTMTNFNGPQRSRQFHSELEYSPTAAYPTSPFDSAGARVDLREDRSENPIIGMERAAEICQLGRTQMWRYARDGKLPHFVTGTPERPEYKFRLADVQAFKRQRDRERSSRQLKSMKRRMKQAGVELRRMGNRTIISRDPRTLSA